MKSIVLIVFCLFTSLLFAQKSPQQKIDSLEFLVKNKKNIDSIIKYDLDIANIKMRNGAADAAITLLHNVIKLSKKNKKEVSIGDASHILSFTYIRFKRNLDSAFFYNQKAVEIYKSVDDSKRLANAYLNTVIIYHFKSDSKNRSKYALLMDEAARRSKDFALIAQSSSMISMTSREQKNWEESLKYSKESLKYAELAKDNAKIANALGEIAFVYDNLKDSVNANIYYEKGYSLAKQNKDENATAVILTNWSRVQRDRKRAIELCLEAQKIYEKQGMNDNYVANTGAIGEFYFELSRREKDRKLQKEYLVEAEKYLLIAKRETEKSENTINTIEANTQLSRVYADKKDYEKAYNYLIESTKLSDSFYSQDSKNKLAKIESQKEIEIRDKEIEVNLLNLETQRKQQLFLSGGVALLAIIGGLLFYQSSLRRKTNKKLTLLNTELDQANKNKTRFFNILNHDLRSPVANLIHFLHLQKNNPELMDLETKNRLENNTISGAENLLSSMEDILLWSKGQMENFKPRPKSVMINELFTDNKKVFSGYVNITFQYDNLENLEILTDKDYLKTIIRNLTSNAINVFINTQNPKIIWKAWKDENGVILSITDNGPGATADKFNALYDEKQVVGIKSGLGLHLIRDLAKAIDCKITVNSEKDHGTTILLTFK